MSCYAVSCYAMSCLVVLDIMTYACAVR